MTENKKSRAQYVALAGGVALIAAAVVSSLIFCLNNSWTEDRMFRVIVAWLLSLFLFEFGRRGRWFARYSLPENLREPLLRMLVGFGGLTFLWSAIKLSFFSTPETLKWSSVTNALAQYCCSFVAIHWAITGKLPSAPDKTSQ